jgi:hypothetical protein
MLGSRASFSGIHEPLVEGTDDHIAESSHIDVPIGIFPADGI